MGQRLSKVFGILREVIWVGVAVAIVAGGVIGFRYLGENREPIVAEAAPRLTELVNTSVLEPIDAPLPIRGEGFVQPHRQLALSSKVNGRVVYVHPAIDERGRFSEGEVLIRLEDETERATLNQTRANLEATEARMKQVLSDLDRARTLLERGVISSTEVDDLETSRDEIEANLGSLRAAMEIAEIALEQRQIEAPFDGAVLTKSVEVGNVINGGQELAEIYSDNRLEIDIAVRQADAALIPGLFEGARAAARAEISFANQTFVWNAHVARVEPRLDSLTRTLTVTVTLEDLADRSGLTATGDEIASGAPPALINAFAEVVIDGAQPAGTYRIPTTALRTGNNLWLLEDGRLATTAAELVHVDGEFSFVRADRSLDGQRLITSAVAAPVPGIELQDAAATETAALTEAAQ
ncbi:MAG: efflux RND transporter periplasmic adaptor subunit [Paracoccaceae bacterium]|nr:efflux RND transporter periplasmic adaptor subunit [Paracoccaceae bacterium]